VKDDFTRMKKDLSMACDRYVILNANISCELMKLSMFQIVLLFCFYVQQWKKYFIYTLLFLIVLFFSILVFFFLLI